MVEAHARRQAAAFAREQYARMLRKTAQALLDLAECEQDLADAEMTVADTGMPTNIPKPGFVLEHAKNSDTHEALVSKTAPAGKKKTKTQYEEIHEVLRDGPPEGLTSAEIARRLPHHKLGSLTGACSRGCREKNLWKREGRRYRL